MVDVVEQCSDRLDLIMIPKVGTAADVYALDMLVTQIEAAKNRRKRIGFELIIETALGMRGMGIALLALALALIVAAPIVGQIPLGLAVCLVGLGLVERDGLVVMGGLVIGLFGVAINAGFAYAVIAGIAGLLNL